jgi:RNA polymerase sigma-70 factor (ECF subfamily)
MYRGPLTQAAIAITGSATLGHDLADSLYAELYGLRQTEGQRRSPLASYSGRGALLAWLRTTLGQRFVDHHRRTRRETPIETLTGTFEVAAPVAPVTPTGGELERLTQAVARTLKALPAEDRFVLCAYFLDRQTLLQIGRQLRVHEATISRRLKRLTADLRKHLAPRVSLPATVAVCGCPSALSSFCRQDIFPSGRTRTKDTFSVSRYRP